MNTSTPLWALPLTGCCRYEDEYKKALQLIKLAAQNQQTEEFEHRKAG